jgi:hypothetical protein
MRMHPELKVGADWEPFFSVVLDLEVKMMAMEKSIAGIAGMAGASSGSGSGSGGSSGRSSSSSSGVGSVVSGSAKRAVQVAEVAVDWCPDCGRFWTLYEDLVRSQGDHKLANHIHWRREQQQVL